MRVAVVAASLEILGGQGVQAQALVRSLREDGVDAALVPINPRFPLGMRWMRRLPYARTALNQLLYVPGLSRLASYDVAPSLRVVQSFLFRRAACGPRGCSTRASCCINHSGESEGDLANGVPRAPWLTSGTRSSCRRRTCASVREVLCIARGRIPNIVDLTVFDYRERRPLRARLLATRISKAYTGSM